MKPAIFLDRDGVINQNRHDYVKSWSEYVFLSGAFEALRRLASTPFAVVVVTNQSPINRGFVPQHVVEQIHQRMIAEIHEHEGRIDAVFYCPHHPDENCFCRKPRPGLLLQAAQQLELDLGRSFLIGDAVSDLDAALAVGVQPFLVLTGRGREQMQRLRARGTNGVHVVKDIKEAVEHILEQSF